MSRDTIFTKEPSVKYFCGDDLKMKPKRVAHLHTHSNFLEANEDHSVDRPFSSKKSYRVRPNIENSQHAFDRSALPVEHDSRSEKIKPHPNSAAKFVSSFNILEFEPARQEPHQRSPIKIHTDKGLSSLKGSSLSPFNGEDSRVSLASMRRVGKYMDSSNMKDTLSHLN